MLTGLVGRAAEGAAIEALLASTTEWDDGPPTGRHGALLLSGPPGIGKSSLLDRAATTAAEAGFTVLRLDGLTAEVAYPFAGLHRLLRPLAPDLPEPLAAGLQLIGSAVSGHGTSPPTVARAAMTALEILTHTAGDAPLLVLVDDAHWLDPATWDALAFVGRRIDLDPVALLMAVRPESEAGGRPAPPGLELLDVRPLDDAASSALLAASAPQLPDAWRTRLLDEAQGNPLAIIELSKTVDAASPVSLPPERLPLSARLEHAFAQRLIGLPPATDAVLLVGAADDGDDLDEILAAAALLTGRPVQGDDLDPAVRVGLVVTAGRSMRFVHPLMRSAVYQRATRADREAAHAALAAILETSPDRRVWHLAESTHEPDPGLADELTRAAAELRSAGDTTRAFRAAQRALELTEEVRLRESLTVLAVELAFDLGWSDTARELLPAPGVTMADPLLRNRLAVFRELLTGAPWSGAERVRAFADIARELHDVGASDEALAALQLVAMRMWWSNPDAATRDHVVTAAVEVARPERRATLMSVLAMSAPFERGPEVVTWLGTDAPDVADRGADEQTEHAITAGMVGDYRAAIGPCRAAVDLLRRQGRLGALAEALVLSAWADTRVGLLPRARVTAAEAELRTAESDRPLWLATAQTASAVVSASRGDLAGVAATIESAHSILIEEGAYSMLGLVQHARATAALAAGRFSEAYDEIVRVFDPDDVSFSLYYRTHVVGDLAEAAVHSGRQSEAAEHVDAMAELAVTRSPILLAQLAYARALLADPVDAEALFLTGLAGPLVGWPLVRARSELAFGETLRRRREIPRARAYLRSALATLDALGASPWADRARQELRASGEGAAERSPSAWESLTAQEVQIARLAAQGLTNRDIGDRLLLSHRTVSTHLYRIYPKLGVTSRAQLSAALGTADAAPQPYVI